MFTRIKVEHFFYLLTILYLVPGVAPVRYPGHMMPQQVGFYNTQTLDCHDKWDFFKNTPPSPFFQEFTSTLKGVFVKNERGYRLNAIKKRF